MKFYDKDAVLKTVTQLQLAEMSKMLKFLIEQGKITKECGQITLDRIARNNELELIYLW